jgi:hypothetical protein
LYELFQEQFALWFGLEDLVIKDGVNVLFGMCMYELGLEDYAFDFSFGDG